MNNGRMDTRRLQILAELSRLGSMRAVADVLGITTSTVSQQVATLSRDMGTALIEPAGRLVRLTPAGRRLAEHAVTILAAVESAHRDLGPGAEPNGTLRVAGFATAIRGYLLPVVVDLAATSPQVHLLIREHEPAESLELLATDQVDLALTYDYNLAPAAEDPTVSATPLWTARWGLGVPADAEPGAGSTTLDVFARFRTHDWIVNSRNTADEKVIRTLASMAGFHPGHPPGRQPRPGAGDDRGGPGRGAATGGLPDPARRAARPAGRPRRRAAGLRGGPARPPRLAAARPGDRPAQRRRAPGPRQL